MIVSLYIVEYYYIIYELYIVQNMKRNIQNTITNSNNKQRK